MVDKLESAKTALIDEFTQNEYTRVEPFGNSASDRKIQEYVIACVDAKVYSTDMWEWFDENIIKQFGVTGVDRSTMDFAHRVLDRKSKEFQS